MSLLGNLSLRERIESRITVNPETGCWLWEGSETSGYGTVSLGGRTFYAHRLMWQIKNGEIPEDKPHILHDPVICTSTLCVNPLHLRAGTQSENVCDAALRRIRSGEHHPLLGTTCSAETKKYISESLMGDKSLNAKLTWPDADKIRELYTTGHYSQTEIGKMFGVVCSTINKIVLNRSWKRE